ncbi:MAG: TolC family protein, partial [Pontiella sp.]|nr:TolC family protein [Pontiella sp.]
SGLVRRLERSGLLKRTRCRKDQRVVHITLTVKGARLIEEAIVNRRQGIQNTFAPLTGAERGQYKSIMEKILQHGIRLTVLVLTCASTTLFAAEQQPVKRYSLDESVRIGLKRSLTVANAAREREIAAATRQRALSDAFPKLTGIADYSLYDADNLTDSGSRTVGAEASWQVFTGGRTISAIRAAAAFKQLTAYQERRVRETQVRDIALAYYLVQLAKAQVDVRVQSVKQLAEFETEAKKKYDAGTVSEFDWLSAKVAWANEKPRLITTENDLSLAMERFRNLTYIDDAVFELSDPLAFIPMELELNEAIASGLRKRPDLLEKVSAVELRKEDINQQVSDYYPRVNLFANYNYYKPDPFSFLPGSSTDGWQDHWSAGVRASWSLFDGGSRKADLSESKLNMAIEEDEYRDMRRAASLDIRTQWLRARDAKEVIDAAGETVALAERALAIARTRFDAGLSTNLEVTQANLELNDARLSRSQALYEYIVAVTGIKYAAGMLLEEYE